MIIYKITNKINKKVYIGLTTRKNGFNGRYPCRGIGAERVYKYHKKNKESHNSYNKHLLDSMDKYGVENFEVDEEFDTAETKEELIEKEKYWIRYYNSDNPNFGYNETTGGESYKINYLSKLKIRIKNSKGFNHKIEYLSKVDYSALDIQEWYGWSFWGIESKMAKMIKENNTKRLHNCKFCNRYFLNNHGGKNGVCDYCEQYKKEFKKVIKFL